MRFLKIALMTKSEASHMISSGFDQSGAEIIGTKISSFLRFSLELIHSLSKVKDMFSAKRLVKDFCNLAEVLDKLTLEIDII